MTTLDAETRIQRYVITELSGDLKMRLLQGKHVATAIAVGTAAFLAFATGTAAALTMRWPILL